MPGTPSWPASRRSATLAPREPATRTWATGSYAPRGFAPEVRVPQGAEEADGIDALLRVIRDQIARGADWIKFYADFLWGPGAEARPTFTLDEMKRIVETASAAGCPVAAHATSREGMRLAALAG